MGATAHIDFIAAAYAAAVIVIGALVAWVMLDYRAQRQTLVELDLQGVTRRSLPARPDRALEPGTKPSAEQAREEA